MSEQIIITMERLSVCSFCFQPMPLKIPAFDYLMAGGRQYCDGCEALFKPKVKEA